MPRSRRDNAQLVENVRAIWPSEARHFTPLVAHNNLDQLGTATGLDLALRKVESSVHGRFVDILAEDVTRGLSVVIENQYAESDADHLGRLIAYASGKRAGILIWIAEDFRDDFRESVNWLNSHTTDEVEVYAVSFRAYGDVESPRVEFSLIAAPPAKSHLLSEPRSRPRTKHQRLRDFYDPVVDALAQPEHGFQEVAPRERKSIPLVGPEERAFETAFDGVHWVLGFYDAKSNSRGAAQVQIMIHGGGRERVDFIYESLSAQKTAILAAWGNPPEDEVRWGQIRGKPRYFIGVKRSARFHAAEAELCDVADWMTHWLPRVREVLEPRLRKLLV